MFLEDAQIHLPYPCDAMTRSWSVHGFAHQGACLFVGDTLASPSTLFQIDDHPDHAQPEQRPQFENLAHYAFSSTVSGNVRIVEEIHQFGTISLLAHRAMDQAFPRQGHAAFAPIESRSAVGWC